MKVLIDSRAGFCPGVRRAIRSVEETLQKGQAVTALGSLIHNPREMARLGALGLQIIAQEAADDPATRIGLQGERLFIRTHGIGEKVRADLAAAGLCLVDGTCATVKRVQRLIAEHYARGEQIVIIGKKGHAEVAGLLGHCDQQGIVVEDLADLSRITPDRPTFVVAQTTIGRERFATLSEQVRTRAAHTIVEDTSCGYIDRRYDQIREFAARVDVILFVGGKESSNSRVLFALCRQANPRSYAIESPQQIERNWIGTGETVGLTGGASTPLWQLEEIRDLLLRDALHTEHVKKT